MLRLGAWFDPTNPVNEIGHFSFYEIGALQVNIVSATLHDDLARLLRELQEPVLIRLGRLNERFWEAASHIYRRVMREDQNRYVTKRTSFHRFLARQVKIGSFGLDCFDRLVAPVFIKHSRS